jgi:hypothetical protein
VRFLQERTLRISSYAVASAAVLWGLFWFLEARQAAPVSTFESVNAAASPLGLFLYTSGFAVLNLVFAVSLVALVARHKSEGRPLVGWETGLTLVAVLVALAFVYALVLRGLAIFGAAREDYEPMVAWHLGLSLLGVTLVGAGFASIRAPLHRAAKIFPFLAGAGFLGYLLLPHSRVFSVFVGESLHYVAAIGMIGVAFMLHPRMWRRPMPVRTERAPHRFTMFLGSARGQKTASVVTALGALLWAGIWFIDRAVEGPYRVFVSVDGVESGGALFLWTLLFALAFASFAFVLLALASRHQAAGIVAGVPMVRLFAYVLFAWFAVALTYRGLAIFGGIEEDYGPWHFALLGLPLLAAGLVTLGLGTAGRGLVVLRVSQLAAAAVLSIYLVRSYHMIWAVGVAEAGVLVYAFSGLMFAVGVLLWPGRVPVEAPRGDRAAEAGAPTGLSEPPP